MFFFFFFFKQKTAYEMRISDWSSDVCSSDLQMVAPKAMPRIVFKGFGIAQASAGYGRYALYLALAETFQWIVVAGFCGVGMLDTGEQYAVPCQSGFLRDRKRVV